MGSIYVLTDPRTGEVRYVGKTQRPLGRRLTYHLRDAKLKNAAGDWHYTFHAYSWVRSLLNAGVRPDIEEVEVCSTSEALDEAERFYVDYFRSLGFRLTNTKPGGEGGCAKGRVITPEHRAKLSLAARRQWSDPEKRSRTVEGLQRATSTAEFRQAVSQGKLRSWASRKQAVNA